MRFFAILALAVLVIAPVGLAQANNDGFLSTTVNGTTGPGPISVNVIQGDDIDIATFGSALVPYVLGFGPGITVGNIVAGPIQVDLANPIAIIANGIAPVNFIDFLANTGPAGTSTFSLPIGFQFPAGVLGAFQSVGVDPSAPGGVTDSAASEITVALPLDFGSISYLRGPFTTETDVYGASTTLGSFQISIPSSSIDVEALNLNNYSYMVSNTSQQIFERRDPAIFGATTVSQAGSYDHVNTIHGAVYTYEDNLTDEWAFAVAQAGGAPPLEIPGSRMLNPGSVTTSPFEDDIQISDDQSTIAVVFDPSGGGTDGLFLMKIDGTTFASSGTGVVDITPALMPTTIEETSLQMSGGFVYFTDGTGLTTNNLYSAPIDGSAVATIVTMPATGTGLPVTGVDEEMFKSAGNDLIIVQAGNSSATEDLFAITHPGGVQTITNITNFALSTSIEEFGDAYDGSDGQISVSPDGSRCAFVTVESADDELYWVTTDGLGTPQILTDPTMFETTIDDVVHLNFYDNNNIIAFCGIGTTTLDAYNFDISLAPAVSLSNVTQTNGQDGSILPITASPGASIDHDGYVALPGRMIFVRDGTQALGASAGLSTAHNIVGIDYATLTAYDITGDEFSGGPADPQAGSSSFSHEFVFSNTGILWFKAQPGTTTLADEELYSVDTSMMAPAMAQTAFLGTASDIDNITPDDTGASCLVSYRFGSTSADEEIYSATFGVFGVTQITSDATSSSDVTDGSINFVPAGGGFGFTYAIGTTSSANPSDATLTGYDFASGLTTVIDDSPAAMHIMSVSFP